MTRILACTAVLLLTGSLALAANWQLMTFGSWTAAAWAWLALCLAGWAAFFTATGVTLWLENRGSP